MKKGSRQPVQTCPILTVSFERRVVGGVTLSDKGESAIYPKNVSHFIELGPGRKTPLYDPAQSTLRTSR
ncbi:hypothetical protein ABAC402_17235 [Asticcacaulis sp. AC402]|nr:hypothetical protein ABAC402_17235 [Asticcacaulis sp. AC402]